MKKLEFETSKGRFLVVDGVGEDFAMDLVHMVVADEWFIKLSEITENQAIEIVQNSIHTGLYAHYVKDIEVNTFCYNTAIESLHSLLKSKGIHLYENPFYHGDLEDYAKYKDAEQKTFYNPYIFKLQWHK